MWRGTVKRALDSSSGVRRGHENSAHAIASVTDIPFFNMAAYVLRLPACALERHSNCRLVSLLTMEEVCQDGSEKDSNYCVHDEEHCLVFHEDKQ